MLINCRVLSGEDFEFIEEANLRVSTGKIEDVSDGFVSEGVDLKNCLAIPGLINAHTHLGDSFAKDACAGLSVHEAVGRDGKKWELYKEVPREELIKGMRDSALEMVCGGVTCFADFREGGLQGINDLRAAVRDVPIKAIALGRDLSSAEFETSDGLGINVYQIDQVPTEDMRNNKIIAVHAGEVEGEIGKAIEKNPDLIVHFTKASDHEISEVANKKISLVLCPRSNASLRVGFPPARKLFEAGANVCLGTDNIMINSPDLWREMEFLYKFSQINGPLGAKEVLSSATVNPAKAFRLNSGFIGPGRDADITFIDMDSRNLRDSRDIITTIVTRTRHDNIAKVMFGGGIHPGK